MPRAGEQIDWAELADVVKELLAMTGKKMDTGELQASPEPEREQQAHPGPGCRRRTGRGDVAEV